MSVEKFKSLQLDKNFTPLTLQQMREIEPNAFKMAFKQALPLNDGSLQENIKRLLPKINQLLPETKSLTSEDLKVFRNQHAIGQKWAIANIVDGVKKQLGAKTNEVWLSDDTLIKMIINHPELDLLPLFLNVQGILDNATKIVKKDDLNVIYFTKNGKNYITVIKATKDKSELYLQTIYKADEQEFNRQIKKLEK